MAPGRFDPKARGAAGLDGVAAHVLAQHDHAFGTTELTDYAACAGAAVALEDGSGFGFRGLSGYMHGSDSCPQDAKYPQIRASLWQRGRVSGLHLWDELGHKAATTRPKAKEDKEDA